MEAIFTGNVKDSGVVSIGIPVHNGDWCLREALDSLLSQTYRNLEIVISDNASTDRTAEICQEYAHKDQRIHYYRNSVDIGLIGNFGRVFELSSGEYFMWAAADDIRPPTAVEACVAVLQRNHRAVMAHGPILVKIEGRENLVHVANHMDLSDLEAGRRVGSFTKHIEHRAIVYGLHRRWALNQAKRKPGYGEDYILSLQVCFLGPVEYVTTPMIIYRERSALHSTPAIPLSRRLTLRGLLTSKRRLKCLILLFTGCTYLMKIRSVSLHRRIAGVAANVVTFTSRHRNELAKDLVFLLFIPAAWLIARGDWRKSAAILISLFTLAVYSSI